MAGTLLSGSKLAASEQETWLESTRTYPLVNALQKQIA